MRSTPVDLADAHVASWGHFYRKNVSWEVLTKFYVNVASLFYKHTAPNPIKSSTNTHFYMILTILSHIRQYLGNKCCLNVDQMLIFKFFKHYRYFFISVSCSYRQNSPRTLQYNLDTMQESINTDFLGEGWISSKNVEKMVATFFSNRVKKIAFCDITIIFLLKHVFILIVHSSEKIIVIGFVEKIVSPKNEPTTPKSRFGGGLHRNGIFDRIWRGVVVAFIKCILSPHYFGQHLLTLDTALWRLWPQKAF